MSQLAALAPTHLVPHTDTRHPEQPWDGKIGASAFGDLALGGDREAVPPCMMGRAGTTIKGQQSAVGAQRAQQCGPLGMRGGLHGGGGNPAEL